MTLYVYITTFQKIQICFVRFSRTSTFTLLSSSNSIVFITTIKRHWSTPIGIGVIIPNPFLLQTEPAFFGLGANRWQVSLNSRAAFVVTTSGFRSTIRATPIFADLAPTSFIIGSCGCCDVIWTTTVCTRKKTAWKATVCYQTFINLKIRILGWGEYVPTHSPTLDDQNSLLQKRVMLPLRM